jgi:hypothetical protein
MLNMTTRPVENSLDREKPVPRGGALPEPVEVKQLRPLVGAGGEESEVVEPT